MGLPRRRCAIPLALSTRVLAAAASIAAVVVPNPEDKASVGGVVPDFAFGDFLAGSDGRQKLSEFRGQPVFIVNWTDTDFGRGAAVRTHKFAKDLIPDGLVVILRDTHNKNADEILVSAMRRYPGSLARFARNMKLPIEYQDNGPPPDIALIDVEGRLVIAGSYTVDMGPAEKRIAAELKRRQTGWGTHDAVRDVRAICYGKGRIGEALVRCEKALAAEPENAELKQVESELRAQFEADAQRVRYALDRGECALARSRASALADAAVGSADWQAVAESLLAEFEKPDVQKELALDAELAAALKPLQKKEPTAKDVEKLERVAKDAGDTRVGRRAKELARIAALSAAR